MSVFLAFVAAAALRGPAPHPRTAVAPPDSVGQEMRGGQRLLRHRVGGGETLFALARRYRVSVADLTAANPQLTNGLGIGQVVLVPRPAPGKPGSKTAKADKADKPGKPAASAAPARYTVAKGDNLYALAKRFAITRDDLIRLNSLPADGRVKVGQQLVLRAETGAAAVAAAARPSTAPASDPTPAPNAPDPAKPAQVATVTPAAPASARDETPKEKDKDKDKDKEKDKDDAPTRASEVVGRITESGLGAGIERSGTDKYLALHKTAPVGTIMQVKNQMTGQSVYVRVIGKLPDTGENNNILVRVSPRALQKLGTADSRFRVETSYVP